MTLPAPTLEHTCDLTVYVSAPIEAGHTIGLNSRGRRRIIPITGGKVVFAPTLANSCAAPPPEGALAPSGGRAALAEGPLTGTVLPGGADFQLVVSDTSADLDARYLLALSDGSHVFVQNHALRRGSAEDIARLVRGEPVDPAAIYFRCVPTFEVSSPAHAWMTESVFVGTGARFPDRVEISVYRVA
jgi:Protein of unknown function (DUF3237)